jgi:uncharacterized protein
MKNTMHISNKQLLVILFTANAWLHCTTIYAQMTVKNPYLKIKSIKPKLQPLPLHDVMPSGWLQQELQKNMDGFTGHLDSLVPDLILNDDIYGKNRLSKATKSKNVGAIAEEGEWQVQYLWWNSETQGNWLDGYIRTAILLNDAAQLRKAEAIVNRLLATQDADGYIGIYDKELRYKFNNENGELWAKTTLYRALLGWYEYKKDARILAAVEKAVTNVMQAYPINQSHPFYSVNPNVGGVTHGLAFTDVLEHLYRITQKQAYSSYCLFLYKDFSVQVLNEDAQCSKLLDKSLPLKGHGVHTYEHLRSVIAAYYASANPVLKQALNNFLYKIKLATTPSGAPIGDEFIGGRTATAAIGYEYCSLHELMAGWISLLDKSADRQYADAAEHLFFNAALGNTHPTESSICYLKQDNAFYLTGGNNGDTSDKHQTRYRYSPVHKEAAVCCVPNAGRIVPYYIQNMWMKDKDGLVATLLGPCDVHTSINNQPVSIQETTAYPFENNVTFTISCKQALHFTLKVRKPNWATSVTSSLPYKEQDGYLLFERQWNESTKLSITFGSAVVQKQTANKEVYFQSGALVLCHPINAVQSVTKNYTIVGLKESVYAPITTDRLQYHSATLKPTVGKQHTFTTSMVNAATGANEQIILVPMAKTILRQVTFQTKP